MSKAATVKPAQAEEQKEAQQFPCMAHVKKSGDAIPVEVKSQEHLDRLIAEHGAGVEVVK